MPREKLKRRHRKSESTEADLRGGLTRSSEEVSVMEMERRGWIVLLRLMNQPEMGGIRESGKVV